MKYEIEIHDQNGEIQGFGTFDTDNEDPETVIGIFRRGIMSEGWSIKMTLL